MTQTLRATRSAPVHPTPVWAHAGKSLLLPAFWVVLLLIAGGGLRLVMFIRESFAIYPIATLTALVLFGLYAVPFCVFVAALDYLEREPPLLLATAFAWGGLVAALFLFMKCGESTVSGGFAQKVLVLRFLCAASVSLWCVFARNSSTTETQRT